MPVVFPIRKYFGLQTLHLRLLRVNEPKECSTQTDHKHNIILRTTKNAKIVGVLHACAWVLRNGTRCKDAISSRYKEIPNVQWLYWNLIENRRQISSSV